QTWYEWDLAASPVQDVVGPSWEGEVTVRSRDGGRQASYWRGGSSLTIRNREGQVIRKGQSRFDLSSVTFSPNGRFVLSICGFGSDVALGMLWETDTGKPGGGLRRYSAAELSPDGRLVAFADGSGVSALDFDEAREVVRVPGADYGLFTHDSRRLVTIH